MHQHHHQPYDNQRHNGDDFNHRKPELHLTKHFYRGEVQAQQQDNHRQRSNPIGEAGEPELGVGGNRHHIGHPSHHPAEPIGPTGEIARPRAKQVCGKVAKRLIFQVREQQLTHGAHDEEEHKTDDHINENDRWPSETDSFSRPHKQACPDGTADRDKLNVSVR